MYRYQVIGRKYWYLIAPGCLVLVLLLLLLFRPSHVKVASFDDCVRYDFPLSETDPQTCVAYNHTYVGPYEGAVQPAKSELIDTLNSEIIVTGDSRGNYPKLYQVITTTGEWTKFWTAVHASLPTPPNIFPIDFNQFAVVAVVMGQQPTNGYSIKIQSVARISGIITIHLALTTPAVKCQLDPHPTNPYFMVRIPKLTQREADTASFVSDNQVRACN